MEYPTSELTLLRLHLGRLAGGDETVAAFRTWWFQNAWWDETSDDVILEDLGSGITALLYQSESPGIRISPTILASEIYRRVLFSNPPSFQTEGWKNQDPGFWGPLAPAMQKEIQDKAPRMAKAAEILSRRDAWDRLL